ncbi:helix-turn-helix transcriptional regulator [Streptomyces sp. NK08204]|uniref:ArsR/SmtB family transcription factor n=1 Tax=Streptomyces sp. NK08204 TaxID=2873260 RepID=UPI001CEDD2FD|nr:winged helix-turn-helix domain-containing protein [Streptomyces sp. NK08204]
MDAQTLANTRLAISPLGNMVDALWLVRKSVQSRARGWSALLRESFRDEKLILLTSLFGGSWDYVPDFLTPQPEASEMAVQDELHRVAGADPERLRIELQIMIEGNRSMHVLGSPAPRSVLDAVQQGERAFAERLAAELDRLWQVAIGPNWAPLRARIEADITRRAHTTARDGLAGMLTSLHPRIMWGDDHLRLITRFQGRIAHNTCLVLTPSVFNTDLHMIIDPLPHGPLRRQPMLVYPAPPESGTEPAAMSPAGALLGVTRAKLLSDLETPRTTTELSGRHFLAASSVSYHLGILHRSGLVTRTRVGHRVLYQRTLRAGSLLQEGI